MIFGTKFMRNEDHISFLKWTSNWLGIAPLTLFWRPILVEENPAFWPNPPFWTGFQPVSSLHNRHDFFFAFLQESEGKREVSEKRRQARRGRRRENNGRPHTIVFFAFRPRHTPQWLSSLAFAPASGLIAFARLKNARLLCRLAS